MIQALALDELRSSIAQALGLECATSDAPLIRAALRRAIYPLAPTSRSSLLRNVSNPLKALGIDREAVEDCLDDLIAYGDIFEMKRFADDPWDTPAVVLRPAPPGFVCRSDGSVVLLGVAGDYQSALTPDFDELVDDAGPVRTLQPIEARNLREELSLLGLVQLNEATWLQLPASQSPSEFLEHFEQALDKLVPTAGGVAQLEILDPAKSVRFYKGRWTAPSKTTDGLRLARRPQDYGAPLWTIALFQLGLATKVYDLLEYDGRESPRDIAWRFQAALDAKLGRPQEITLRKSSSGAALDFYSPLPAFAERHLALVGIKTTGPGRLFSFELPPSKLEAEIGFLECFLWMRVDRGELSQ